ncbi:3-isopropylmalate/(R)-2-methylmalate dehydratase small subunit [Streptomyces sp. Ag109_O5-1]|uniref:3-isopropylmalate dehydratase small subunit n=1 Tax=Streptomyces TaxID=1883 RepID=UPI000F4D5592|nr:MULTISPECIES: 3-isopropylmalate dehydratase small subunit [Streptomyces]RPE47142.1 3-isopropylmalate/(R)-2-methylmalate dehydratase small subunit [Streptomyces sp. Ag109_O5-1]
MYQFTVHTGSAVPLRRSNVDTDQIIPVRFLNRSQRTGHADSLFADWRDDPAFVLNQPQYQGATILVAGTEFGTGSSREYAVWALLDYGFRAVIAPRYGDIFRENALQNGLLPVELPTGAVEQLWDRVEARPDIPVTVDLQRLSVRCAGHSHPFALEEHARQRLLAGEDRIAQTLRHAERIAAFERGRRAALPVTT